MKRFIIWMANKGADCILVGGMLILSGTMVLATLFVPNFPMALMEGCGFSFAIRNQAGAASLPFLMTGLWTWLIYTLVAVVLMVVGVFVRNHSIEKFHNVDGDGV
jgi:hypothetical protein